MTVRFSIVARAWPITSGVVPMGHRRLLHLLDPLFEPSDPTYPPSVSSEDCRYLLQI